MKTYTGTPHKLFLDHLIFNTKILSSPCGGRALTPRSPISTETLFNRNEASKIRLESGFNVKEVANLYLDMFTI